ncbi:MAG: YcfL family protein [Phycisphaeraceae bacterium]|nr:MAG: YcfL family protein [Phycisphaeraceae bacterium]
MNNRSRVSANGLLAGAAVGAAWLASTGGCGTPGPIPAGGDPVAPNNYPRVEVDAGLGGFVVAGRAIVRREGGVLSVWVPVRNTDVKDLNVQYLFTFFDKDGAELREQSGWRFTVLPSRTEVQLQGNAMSTTAEDWRLKIRVGR